MLWRMSDLDNITLLSNSDAHSPEKLGREVNVFDTELDYFSIIEAIKSKDKDKLIYTVEFFPEEGKYHYDGHRACDVCLTPKESEKYNNICPVCGKPLTIGVLNRINTLADRAVGFKPKNVIPFKSLVPLKEIIAEVVGTLPGSKRVNTEYENLINKFESEFEILLNSSYQDLEKATLPKIAEGVIKVRQGKVNVLPGYDGVFGKVEIFSKTERQVPVKQDTLF